jgi:hypothetical protein
MTKPSEPTLQDHANAALRQEIAARQQAEYDQVLAWAKNTFGRGWEPSGRHYLVDHDEEDRVRYTDERPVVAATVFMVKNWVGRKRHFTVDAEGKVTEYATWEQGFGDMLLEPHPTRTIEVRGQQVHPHRYSLCWAGYELYEPKTAEQLASLRVNRERGKAEREEKRWAAENPLLAWAERANQQDTPVEEEGQER